MGDMKSTDSRALIAAATRTTPSPFPAAARWIQLRRVAAGKEKRGLGGAALRTGWHGLLAGRLRQTTYALIDVLLVCLSGGCVFWLRFGFVSALHSANVPTGSLLQSIYLRGYPGFLLLYCGLIVLACMSQHLYRTPREIGAFEETLRVLRAVMIATTLLVLFIFTSGNKDISRLVVASTGLINVVTLAGWRYAKRKYVMQRALRGEGLSRILIVGAGKMGQTFADWIENHRQLGYTVCGFLDAHPNGDKRVLGSTGDLRRVALAQFANEVFIAPPTDRDMVKEVFLQAQQLHLSVHVLAELYDGLCWRAPLHTIGGFPVLKIHEEPILGFGLAVKRAMDIVASFVGLLLVSPFLAAAAVWIRLDSPGPAIYSALRVGKKGKKFRCYKLRTMVVLADEQKDSLRKTNGREGPFFKMENDPRVTRCGRWLRKYSIDELPQLVNVLLGEMSLVGPRPHPLDDYERYSIEHLRRLDVKPGITGLWQVTARRNPSFETNMALDLEYIENWNLSLDLWILLKTLREVGRASGT